MLICWALLLRQPAMHYGAAMHNGSTFRGSAELLSMRKKAATLPCADGLTPHPVDEENHRVVPRHCATQGDDSISHTGLVCLVGHVCTRAGGGKAGVESNVGHREATGQIPKQGGSQVFFKVQKKRKTLEQIMPQRKNLNLKHSSWKIFRILSQKKKSSNQTSTKKNNEPTAGKNDFWHCYPPKMGFLNFSTWIGVGSMCGGQLTPTHSIEQRKNFRTKGAKRAGPRSHQGFS